MRFVPAASLTRLALLVLLAALPLRSLAQAVTPVPQLDLDRFSGTWYVIANLPEKRFKRCNRDSVLLVALGDPSNSVQLLNACQTKRGYTEATNIDGKAQHKSVDGQLKLRTIWPFSRKLWVLALAPDYQWSLLGSPNHKSLAILSRSSTLPPPLLARIEAQATAQGFSTAKLVQQPQDLQYKAD